jgi:hypothetical protein
MAGLQITVATDSGAPDPALAQELAHELAQDIDRHVAPAQLTPGEARPGAKGDMLSLATLAVGAVSSGGVAVLIDVLKSYLGRNDALEIEIEGPGGKVRLKGRAAAGVTREQIQAAVANALGTGAGP